MAAACGVVIGIRLARLGGLAAVNLDVLLREPLHFYAWLVVPAGAGAACLAAALLPRVVAINLAVALGLLAAAETGARVLAPTPPAVRGWPEAAGGGPFYVPDATLGYVMAPSAVARHRRTIDDALIYDVVYRTDERGRRVTPTSPDSGRARFLLFFGDSNVFGEGLDETQTLPFHAGEAAPGYRPYNYGVSGYGPAHLLAAASLGRLRAEVAEREGYAVYLLIPAHVGRVVGSSDVSTGWGRHFPYYVDAADGPPRRQGDFVHARPFTTLAYYFWTRSRLAGSLGGELPLRYTAGDYRLTARVLREAGRLLAQQLELRGFVVVLAQVYSDPQRELMDGVRAALEREGVRYLDYTRLFDSGDVRYRLAELDYHHSALANRALAARLVADLVAAR